MTCIVGVEAEAGAVVAGDAVHTAGWRRTNSADPKVCRVGPAVIGTSGSSRVHQIAVYTMSDMEWGSPTMEWMVTGYVPALRKALRDGGVLKIENGLEDNGSAIIVGMRQRIFTIWSDFQVEPPSRGYQAVGSGAEVAVGSLYATSGFGLPATTRARLALEAAAEHVASVGPPFEVVRAGMERLGSGQPG